MRISLHPANMQVIKGFLLALLIVVLVAFIGAAIGNAKGPPEQVVANQPIIEDAKARLEKNRPAHEAFLADKALIEKHEKENNALGWRTDWATLHPVPIEPSF